MRNVLARISVQIETIVQIIIAETQIAVHTMQISINLHLNFVLHLFLINIYNLFIINLLLTDISLIDIYFDTYNLLQIF